MKFKTSIVDIKTALLKAKTTISQKDVQPVLRNFCLKLEGSTLSILATDLDLATVCKIMVEGTEDGIVTVPGLKFFDIVNLSSAENLEFYIADGSKQASVKAGKYSAFLQCLSADDFPTIAEFEESAILKADRGIFLESLNRISFSISDNEARKNLLAVFIDGGYIQATDGHVSSVTKFSGDIKNTLIPSLAVPDLVRVLRSSSADFIEVSSNASFLMFRLGKDLFVTRLSQAQFPDIPNKVLKPTENNNIVISVQKKEFLEAVRRVAITSNSNSNAVTFTASGKVLKISSIDVEGNNSEEEVDAQVSEDIEFLANHGYIEDICKSIYSDSLVMKMASAIRVPIRIEDGDFITLLMRLSIVVKQANAPAATNP